MLSSAGEAALYSSPVLKLRFRSQRESKLYQQNHYILYKQTGAIRVRAILGICQIECYRKFRMVKLLASLMGVSVYTRRMLRIIVGTDGPFQFIGSLKISQKIRLHFTFVEVTNNSFNCVTYYNISYI